MTTRITNLTTVQDLQRETKLNLAKLLIDAGELADEFGAYGRKTKDELVGMAMRVVDRLNAEKAAADAKAEGERMEKLNAEKAEGKTHLAIGDLLAAINTAIRGQQETIENFQKKVAGSYWDIESALVWHAEDVLHATGVIGRLAATHRFLEAQNADQTKTADEIAAMLSEVAEDEMRACLDDGYRHCSTNAIDNVKNMAEFKARQFSARWHKNAAKTWNRVMKDVRESHELVFVRDSRW